MLTVKSCSRSTSVRTTLFEREQYLYCYCKWHEAMAKSRSHAMHLMMSYMERRWKLFTVLSLMPGLLWLTVRQPQPAWTVITANIELSFFVRCNSSHFTFANYNHRRELQNYVWYTCANQLHQMTAFVVNNISRLIKSSVGSSSSVLSITKWKWWVYMIAGDILTYIGSV